MKDFEKMQKLHERSVLGGRLSNAEKAELKRWYEANDKEEAKLFNASAPRDNSELRERLDKITRQIAKVGGEIETLASQNVKLSRENNVLRRMVESALLEKTA